MTRKILNLASTPGNHVINILKLSLKSINNISQSCLEVMNIIFVKDSNNQSKRNQLANGQKHMKPLRNEWLSYVHGFDSEDKT